MVDEEIIPVPCSRIPKKPVPLPRKTLVEAQNKSSSISGSSDEGKSEKHMKRGDWKTASDILQKSKLMKHEVHKLERSMRSMMTKRRSVHPKPSKTEECVDVRSTSLPGDCVFSTICFDSPLNDRERKASLHNSDSDMSSEESFYTTSELPPPFPPPALPDESIYDEVTSATSSDGPASSYYSDCNSIYEDLSKFRTAENATAMSIQKENDSDSDLLMKSRDRTLRSDSWSFYDTADQTDGRYEVIEDDCFNTDISRSHFLNTLLTPCSANFENCDDVEEGNLRETSMHSVRQGSTTSVLYQFDPLLNLHNSKPYDLLSEISESIPALQHALCKETATQNTSSAPPNVFQSMDVPQSNGTNPFYTSKSEDILTKKNVFSGAILNSRHTVSGEGMYGKIKRNEPDDVRLSMQEEAKQLGVTLPPAFAPPPIPPRRLDSITNLSNSMVSELNLEISSEQKDKLPEVVEKIKGSGIIRWSSMKRVARMVAGNIENHPLLHKKLDKKPPKGDINQQTTAESTSTFYANVPAEDLYVPVLNHSGVLYRPGGVTRWGVLSQRKLTIFANKDSPEVKETVPVDTVLSLKSLQENKVSSDGNAQFHCFEISTRTRNAALVFAAPSASERHVWMRKLLESITPAFPAKLSFDYAKAGWCYMKDGISRDWTNASLLIHQRSLHLAPRNGALIVADLRKARYITLQDSDLRCKKATESGPLLVIDLQDQTLYLQMDCPRETAAWKSVVQETARANGPTLAEQQLTKEDVPIVLEKCVNFVHTNGSLSEGIYRRNGSNSIVTKLLSALRADAWSVQLTRQDYSEYDVSSVLKRFLRDLPEPLFCSELHQDLKDITEHDNHSLDEKLAKYRTVLAKLPPVNLTTAKKLMGHLYFVDKQKYKNLMGADNLAAIWGPTLLHVQEGTTLDPNWSRVESSVVNDLITHYPALFQIDQAELQREWKILEVLETYHFGSNSQLGTTTKKPSGDLKIWVHLVNRGDTVSVSVTPHKTAGEVCKELCPRLGVAAHELSLEEVICNESMFRLMHHSELVLDTVLRWGYWAEQDRKDNCLVLRRNDLLQKVVPLARPPVLFNEELRFADRKGKGFRTYQFEVAQASLSYYKDKTCSTKLGGWPVQGIVWYLGHEVKRNPHAGWAITFFERETHGPRSKEKPYFGNTICGASEELKLKVIVALLVAQYGQDIVPSPVLLE